MKFFIIAIGFLSMSYTVCAQSVTPAVLNSAGSSAVVNDVHFEFNMGETFVATITNNQIITQGLLQPLSSAQGPLPVLGLMFTAKRVSNGAVELKWSTQQEINNAGFYIERLREGEGQYSTIAQVLSAAVNGNSSAPLHYAFIDEPNFGGKIFYRLRQRDKDGQEIISEIRVVSPVALLNVSINVWPVPAVDKVNVMVKGIVSPQILSVLDMQGRLVKKVTVVNDQTIVLSGLVKGMYVLRLNTGMVSEKIVMQ